MKGAIIRERRLYSYVVEHDTGYAPNPYGEYCTLCRCKFRKSESARRNIVELAKEGDWIIGTGGASKRSAGHGRLIYAMRVDQKSTRQEYYKRFSHTRKDNEWPRNDFEKHRQFALISRHFYYFGANAIKIPEEFKLEKKGPGFRHNFNQAEISRFLEWLKRQSKPGKCGEPCSKIVENAKGSSRCKSSC